MNKSKVISKAALSCLELGDLMPMAAMTSLRMVCLSNALFALICQYKNLGYVRSMHHPQKVFKTAECLSYGLVTEILVKF